MYHTERRRVIFASIVTAIAIPALWIMSGDDDGSSEPTGGSTIPTAPPTTAYKPETPVFVGGEDGTGGATGEVSVATAPAPNANNFRGKASYRRYPDTLDRPCTAPQAPDAILLTVINVNNGQFTTCTNIRTFTPPVGIDIIIHTDVFSEVGDIADSPIDVRVTW